MSLKEILKDAQGVPTGEYKKIAGGTMYADSPIGSILPYGGTTAPSGWMICNGASLLRTDYAELFAVIGTAFGSADSTHFNIPDLRGEFLRGAGTNSHSGQGNGGSVGTHQDATGIDSFITEQTTHRLVAGYGAQNRNSTINADASTRSGLIGCAYQKVEQSITDVYVDRCFVRPTNTSVNYIIKVMMVSLPLDIESQVDAKAGVGAAMIPLTNEDLNNVIEEGWYYSNGVDSLSNKPESGLYNNVIRMIKQGTTGRYIQEFICFNAGGDKWVREFVTPNYWTAWRKFMTSPEESYSTNEIDTGKTWIDGKKIYRKVVNLGTLPNKTIKTTAHGISGADRFVDVRGIAYTANANTHLPLPYVNSGSNITDTIGLYVNSSNIAVSCMNYDFSAYSGYAILEYTKTTD